MINPIVQLVTLVMVIDNETDENEMELFQSIPKKMTEHLEERSGVNLVITIGKSSKSKNELDDESKNNLSNRKIAELANTTIAKYNETEENQVSEWIKGLANQINGKWIRFHTLKLLVDMACADGDIKKEELDLIKIVAEEWKNVEDVLDFLFLYTKTEWEYRKGSFKNTNKKSLEIS
jgi:uncharacterized tellurite resistance protein B-like protein